MNEEQRSDEEGSEVVSEQLFGFPHPRSIAVPYGVLASCLVLLSTSIAGTLRGKEAAVYVSASAALLFLVVGLLYALIFLWLERRYRNQQLRSELRAFLSPLEAVLDEVGDLLESLHSRSDSPADDPQVERVRTLSKLLLERVIRMSQIPCSTDEAELLAAKALLEQPIEYRESS